MYSLRYIKSCKDIFHFVQQKNRPLPLDKNDHSSSLPPLGVQNWQRVPFQSPLSYMPSLSRRKRLPGPSKMAFAGSKRKGDVKFMAIRNLQLAVRVPWDDRIFLPRIGLLYGKAELEAEYIARIKFLNRFPRFCAGFLLFIGIVNVRRPNIILDKCLIDILTRQYWAPANSEIKLMGNLRYLFESKFFIQFWINITAKNSY